ncbi:UNVERIFIED_CONTAM: hypothetical protein GTU68_022828 [Idotea baltica]|nr:hypothetical protein [Idotea baltica]
MKESYLTYALSVIKARALPDVRDGLKPSQRRILVAMDDLNLGPRSKYRKCAKVAGDTSGNYHPHGEAVVYPTMVRMAQDFSLRYPLVDGQGNFGSIDGDPPAAMRYTEARMAGPAVELLVDLDKETVDYEWNYDETRKQPTASWADRCLVLARLHPCWRLRRPRCLCALAAFFACPVALAALGLLCPLDPCAPRARLCLVPSSLASVLGLLHAAHSDTPVSLRRSQDSSRPMISVSRSPARPFCCSRPRSSPSRGASRDRTAYFRCPARDHCSAATQAISSFTVHEQHLACWWPIVLIALTSVLNDHARGCD